MTRRFRPRRVRDLPAGVLETVCHRCALPGDWHWRRGVVVHKLTPNCEAPVARDDEQEAEAA